MAKHTKGPWCVDAGHRGTAWNIDTADDQIAIALAQQLVGDDLHQTKRAANARLIAAAPDLLEALEVLYNETADYITINHLGDIHHNQSMRAARNAIAKARGES